MTAASLGCQCSKSRARMSEALCPHPELLIR